MAGELERDFFEGMLTWEQPWCQPFRELLAHPKVVPYLNTMFGRGWKMDHSPFLLASTAGTEGLRRTVRQAGFSMAPNTTATPTARCDAA